MTLTLEVTGEAVADTAKLTSLVIDDKNMLGMEYEALRKVIGQVVHAINTMGKQVEKLREDEDQCLEAVQHLEQQISSFEVRSRECEDTCQEIRLQLGTMVVEVEKVPEKPVVQEVRSDIDRKEVNEVIQKLEVLAHDVDGLKRKEKSDADALHAQFAELEDTLSRHQDFFDDELESRLTAADEERVQIKAEFEVLRQSYEETLTRKADKVELGDIVHRTNQLIEGQEANHSKISAAEQQFMKLDGLTDLVDENKRRIQEMWALFGKESQELREWATGGFADLRAAVRSKMNEQEALSHVSELRKEVRELAPVIKEGLSRVETNLRQKAEASEVHRLQDDVDMLNTKDQPKQLLVGTKCLACDRQVSSADATDQGPLSLTDRRQEGELWNEVQRALDRQENDHSRQIGTKDVLKYVAIHVGRPTRASSLVGRGLFDARDSSGENQPPGGHYLMRVGGGGGGLARPQTTGGDCIRAPPREPTPLVRMTPRRNGPPGRLAAAAPVLPAAPILPSTPKDGRRPLNNTVRGALGFAASDTNAGSTTGSDAADASRRWPTTAAPRRWPTAGGPSTTAPTGAPTPAESVAPTSEPYSPRLTGQPSAHSEPYSPPMQPAAQSEVQQREATEYDALPNGDDDDDITPPESLPVSRPETPEMTG
jgi:hypothetical protein